MDNLRVCSQYFDENSPDFLVEYRGNFKEEIDKIEYACGDAITNTIGIVSVAEKDMERLIKDVPSIIFIDYRNMYVLQDIAPAAVDDIETIKSNPYLGLTGRGVLVGMVDTGIDYLNEEFMREDGSSRILSIWDQAIQGDGTEKVYVGKVYDNDKINLAIRAKRENMDPYEIVPSKDEVGHGTAMAGIIGARGYNKVFTGVAHDCEFVVVKLLESLNYKKQLRENGVKETPVYNSAEVLAGVEYLKNYAISKNRPMAIFLGVGTTEGSHDGNNLGSRYLTSVSSNIGLVLVAGVGNEGDSEGHTSGMIKNRGGIDTVELNIPKIMKYFSFNIWVQRPNKMNINIISPAGEISGFLESKMNRVEDIKFYLTNTKVTVKYNVPDYFTGHEVINLIFHDIKPGIWKFQLEGEYVVNGRYDIWLQPKITLPERTVFLKPDPYVTLSVPSTGRKIITVAYYDSRNDSLVPSSGKGFNTNGLINPDIATAGINILTTKVGGGITTMSGSSVATAIVAGSCALLLQWGIVDGNDTTMYTIKVRSYLTYGADRPAIYNYPNRDIGFGRLNLNGSFKVFGNIRSLNKVGYEEYYVENLFVRLPKKKGGLISGEQ